jgi:hypothetical protein
MRLREKFAGEERAELFDGLAGFLDVTGNGPALEEAANALNLSAGALRTAISRLRKQFGEQLRLEIAGPSLPRTRSKRNFVICGPCFRSVREI